MYSRPVFWLEFQLLSDGLQTRAVNSLPLTIWHEKNTPVFSLFSALPTELRFKVWEYMIAPRIVGIACLCLEDGASSAETQREDLWGPHPAITPAVPVLLHINRETRALALKHYELTFEWKVPRVLAGADLHPPVRWRPPVLADPPAPAAEPERTQDHGSFPHISSYHDLLDPSPGVSTSGIGGGAAAGGVREGTATTGPASDLVTGPNTALIPTATARNGGSAVFSQERRTSSPPRTWFNFALDAVYLLGELEPCDSFGFNSPMTYFIPSQTARRVRKAAVSFGALRYGETGGQQIFGSLFHVVDRFPPEVGDGEVLVCVTERDEWTHAMMGHDTGLVDEGRPAYSRAGRANGQGSDGDGTSESAEQAPGEEEGEEGEGNVIQKIWRDWYRGAIVTSPLKNLRFSLIRESDLEHSVYEYMMATPPKRTKGSKTGQNGTSR
ncbi:hypothetical protein F4808DRAFT_455751 [Astrocystis sublimbata]|nr:hypothetical protein F4808DRAFT_455751 [Astrocystis sublimbata]